MQTMKKLLLTFLLLPGICVFTSCSKHNNDQPDTGTNSGHLPGTIYYDWATDGILKINPATRIKSTVLPDNTGRYSWDISQDGKRMLISSKSEDQDYDANLYTYMNLSDGSIIKKFKYYPTGGDLTVTFLSFDEKYIAVGPTYDDGIVIMDINGKVLHNLTSYLGKKIGSHICWMPDNTILFKVENNLYRTNTAFTQATLVRAMNMNDWGSFATNADGSKIALNANNHIWLMNADGSNLLQITESDSQEAYPTFSPDGKYLEFGANFHSTGPFGHLWYLTVIPADGQKYNVNKDADKRVISIIAKGENMPEAADGFVTWR